MHCRLLSHGMAISYDNVIKPCCAWTYDQQWRQDNSITTGSQLIDWHNSAALRQARSEMSNGKWPSSCVVCQTDESNNVTSTRNNANQSQKDFAESDISLEIRPGSTCNFACQTCWPAASSRVAEFHHRAGMIDIATVDRKSITDFEFLGPLRHRIRETVLLGGEPFYDKNCQKFLRWAADNLQSTMIMFTNGSFIDFDWIKNYPGKIILVFSLDAIGAPAEYIRFGTVWSEVYSNFQRCADLPNVEVRVNITVSIYNYLYLNDLIDLLCLNWPSVVSFGYPGKQNPWMTAGCIPVSARSPILTRLKQSLDHVSSADIVLDQKQNALGNLKGIIGLLQHTDFDAASHTRFKSFVDSMDQVKNIKLKDHCPELHDLLWD